MGASTGTRETAYVVAAVIAAPIALVIVVVEWLALVAGLIFIDEASSSPYEDLSRGPYAFLEVQADDVTPVGYDPCKPVRIEINPLHAPRGYRDLVDTAVDHLRGPMGMRFEVIGETDSRDFDTVVERGQPVLVAWADEDEYDELEGDVAGVGGSTALEGPDGVWRYESGAVILDADLFDELMETGDREAAQSIIDHEFGHVMGLDHVADPDQLMYPEDSGVIAFAQGDLLGLGKLGATSCYLP